MQLNIKFFWSRFLRTSGNGPGATSRMKIILPGSVSQIWSNNRCWSMARSRRNGSWGFRLKLKICKPFRLRVSCRGWGFRDRVVRLSRGCWTRVDYVDFLFIEPTNCWVNRIMSHQIVCLGSSTSKNRLASSKTHPETESV